MNIRIIEIVRNSHLSLYTELSGLENKSTKWIKIVVFDILPALIGLYLVWQSNLVGHNSDVINYLLITCSIFAGLLFSLIIVIVDKAKKIKEDLHDADEGKFFSIQRYLRFSKQLITKISFAIIIALMVIVFAILGEINFGFHFLTNCITSLKFHIISFAIFYFSIQFFILVLHIISEMYSVFLHEIDVEN